MYNEIFYNKKLVAHVYDMNKIQGVSFPTPELASFQFGFGEILNDKIIPSHIHKNAKREISNTAEFLYVVSGKMIIDILFENEKFVQQCVLNDNMALLQFCGGHKIEIKSGTKYFEIKQGPYFGREFDKYDIKK